MSTFLLWSLLVTPQILLTPPSQTHIVSALYSRTDCTSVLCNITFVSVLKSYAASTFSRLLTMPAASPVHGSMSITRLVSRNCATQIQKQQQPFNGLWSRTTRVGWYQKKHSPILIIGQPLTSFPFTTIHSIHFVHFTYFTVLSDNLSPGPLWSSPWSRALNFILHTFLHPIIIVYQLLYCRLHMAVLQPSVSPSDIPTRPVSLQYQCYVIYT